MTHGHFVVKDETGEINLYTYHDGHTHDLLILLRSLPKFIAFNHWAWDQTKYCDTKEEWMATAFNSFHVPYLDFAPEFAAWIIRVRPEGLAFMVIPESHANCMHYKGDPPYITVTLGKTKFKVDIPADSMENGVASSFEVEWLKEFMEWCWAIKTEPKYQHMMQTYWDFLKQLCSMKSSEPEFAQEEVSNIGR